MKHEILKKIIDFIKSIFGKKKEKTKTTKKNNATKRSTKKNK